MKAEVTAPAKSGFTLYIYSSSCYMAPTLSLNLEAVIASTELFQAFSVTLEILLPVV